MLGIVVTGMHRSGTSAVASVVSEMGLRCGVRPAGRDAANRLGYFEDLDVMELNDRWLASMGGSWWSPPKAGRRAWKAVPMDIVSHDRRFLESLGVSGRAWFVKDPRISLLLPLWDKLALTTVPIIYCVRNPMDVARSLHLRDGFEVRRGLALWWAYVTEALRNCADREALIIDYDRLIECPSSVVKLIESFVSASCNVDSSTLVGRFAERIDASERRNQGSRSCGLSPAEAEDVERLFSLVSGWHGSGVSSFSDLGEKPKWVKRELTEAGREWRQVTVRDVHAAHEAALARRDDAIVASRSFDEIQHAAQNLAGQVMALKEERAELDDRVKTLEASNLSLASVLGQREAEVVAMGERETHLINELAKTSSECSSAQVNNTRMSVHSAMLEQHVVALEGAMKLFLLEAQRQEARANETAAGRGYRAFRALSRPLRSVFHRGASS